MLVTEYLFYCTEHQIPNTKYIIEHEYAGQGTCAGRLPCSVPEEATGLAAKKIGGIMDLAYHQLPNKQ